MTPAEALAARLRKRITELEGKLGRLLPHPTAEEIIAEGKQYDHTPEQDYDVETVGVGDPDSYTGSRIPLTEFQLERGVSLANRSDPGWRHAELTVTNFGAKIILQGLTANDCKRLSEFFAGYEQRLRQW